MLDKVGRFDENFVIYKKNKFDITIDGLSALTCPIVDIYLFK